MANVFRQSTDLLLAAVGEGTPAFIGNDVPASSPSRGAPYIVDPATFAKVFGTSSSRLRLIEALGATKASLLSYCEIRAILIGGSVVRLSAESPRDCDAVVFYELRESASADEAIAAMSSIVDSARAGGLDLRLIPVDANPADLIKAACYFALLFASERSGCLPKFGSLLLIDR